MSRTAKMKITDGSGEPPDSLAETRDDNENLAPLVGQNIKRLRLRRNLSMEALAKLSGVSRAMLSQIELGRSIPTINSAWKIANAFGVPFSTLITSHETEQLRLIPAGNTKILTSVSGEFSSRALFPFDGERRTEFYEIRLKPGTSEQADAHALGTTENLVVVTGALQISIDGEMQTLSPGDAIIFQADKPHVYRNISKVDLLAYLVMTYVEASS